MGSESEPGGELGWFEESLKSSSQSEDVVVEIPSRVTIVVSRRAAAQAAPIDWGIDDIASKVTHADLARLR